MGSNSSPKRQRSIPIHEHYRSHYFFTKRNEKKKMVIPKLNDITDAYKNFEFHKIDLSDHMAIFNCSILDLINENEKLNNMSPLEILQLVDLNYEFIFKIKKLNGNSFFEKLQDLIIKQTVGNTKRVKKVPKLNHPTRTIQIAR